MFVTNLTRPLRLGKQDYLVDFCAFTQWKYTDAAWEKNLLEFINTLVLYNALMQSNILNSLFLFKFKPVWKTQTFVLLAKVQYCQTNGGPYLIFVIFCTPPHFLARKLYTRKVRKFVTKIASRQNSVNWYWPFWLALLLFWLVYLLFCWRTWCLLHWDGVFVREARLFKYRWISGKFPNGLWPPPAPFSEKNVAIFSANWLR